MISLLKWSGSIVNNLRHGDCRYTIFGNIGDNHVHVNICRAMMLS